MTEYLLENHTHPAIIYKEILLEQSTKFSLSVLSETKFT